MATTVSRQDVSRSSIPVPQPTHPVAKRPVTSDTPTFDWTPVPGADSYRLQLAATEAFEDIYHEETVDGPTSLVLDDVLPDDATTVAWRVRVETGKETPWSSAAHFEAETPDSSTATGSFQVDADPVPIHPIEGAVVDAGAAAFTWEPVPTASGYQLQIAKTEAFDNPMVDWTFDETTSLTLFEGVPAEEAVLYWRVRALFPNATEGPWSNAAFFGTKDDAIEEVETVEQGTTAAPDAPPSAKESPVAAGPALEAHTSRGMAGLFVGFLVVSFLLTLLLITLAL